MSEWVLDTGSTHHICPRRGLFTSFKELDGGLMSMEDDHICRLVGKGTVCIKIYDGTMRELKEVRYIPNMTEYNLSWSFENIGPQRDSWRRHSQDAKWLVGCSEGH